MILQFPECETRQCTIVNVVTDSIDESEEFFRFNLARTPGLHPRIDLDPTEGQVVINENNGKSSDTCMIPRYFFCSIILGEPCAYTGHTVQ